MSDSERFALPNAAPTPYCNWNGCNEQRKAGSTFCLLHTPIPVSVPVIHQPEQQILDRAKAMRPGVGQVPAADPVNHPAHYGGADDPYEAIKVIEAWALGFCLGNTVKYISRAGLKGGEGKRLEDLEKAEWYLRREIDQARQRIESEGQASE